MEAELRPSWRRLFDMNCAPTSVFMQLRCVVVWEFMCSLGMRPEDVQVAATTCPAAFTASLSDKVEPLALLLSELGIPKIEVRLCLVAPPSHGEDVILANLAQIGRMFATTPELLFLDADSVQPTLAVLQDRVPPHVLTRILISHPGILTLQPRMVAEHVLTKMEWLLRMRVDQEYVISLLGRRPQAFVTPLDDEPSSMGLLEELGFTKEQMVSYLPALQEMARSFSQDREGAWQR